MLNICSNKIWQTILQYPLDTTVPVNMNDANGGEGTLKGLVRKVPLNMGSVSTHANIYVGDHVPFDLLLGRPWQRGNYVSIDERPEGTYLIFKDASVQEPQYELLVTPDGTDPNWSFEPAAWYSSMKEKYAMPDLDNVDFGGDDDEAATRQMYQQTVYTAFTRELEEGEIDESVPEAQENATSADILDEQGPRSAPPTLVPIDSPWAVQGTSQRDLRK